jgi:hypothetical protein
LDTIAEALLSSLAFATQPKKAFNGIIHPPIRNKTPSTLTKYLLFHLNSSSMGKRQTLDNNKPGWRWEISLGHIRPSDRE